MREVLQEAQIDRSRRMHAHNVGAQPPADLWRIAQFQTMMAW
jgi:hypothetical protein